jgi:hypothetical protein
MTPHYKNRIKSFGRFGRFINIASAMPSQRITLYHYESPRLKVDIVIYFDHAGNLKVDGFDIGKTVEESLGDSDYEYILTVAAASQTALNTALGLPVSAAESETLQKIAQRFNTNECFSEFQTFLDAAAIPYTTFFWR